MTRRECSKKELASWRVGSLRSYLARSKIPVRLATGEATDRQRRGKAFLCLHLCMIGLHRAYTHDRALPTSRSVQNGSREAEEVFRRRSEKAC